MDTDKFAVKLTEINRNLERLTDTLERLFGPPDTGFDWSRLPYSGGKQSLGEKKWHQGSQPRKEKD